MTDGEKRRKLMRLHRQLQRKFPTLYPTSLRLVPDLGELVGSCHHGVVRGKDRLIITLVREYDYQLLAELLYHEYAHAMEWRPDHQHREISHTDEFGLAYARICRWHDGE